MDLLLLQDENAHHYVPILNLERFVAYFRGIAHNAAHSICRNCSHLCTNRENYQNHVKTCSEHTAAEIVIPKESNTSYTVAIQKLEPCGYAMAAVEDCNATPVYFNSKEVTTVRTNL